MIAWLLWPEILLAGGLCALSWWRPALCEPWWRRLEARVRRVTPAAGLAIAFLAPLSIRVALLPVVDMPKPVVMDEFSYLLGADTFALGRVANPPLPAPGAFRAPYVLTSPAYVSIYPPAQAAVLAFGQVVLGHPWWGVFLSVGLMSAAGFWMARAFAPNGWALLAALLAGVQLGAFTYWMNSYWGGSVAAIGGNLVVGAYGRLRTRLAIGPSCWLTAGAALLVLRRPYEGLALVLTVSLLLVHDLGTQRPKPKWPELVRLLAPLAAGTLGLGLFTVWYNLRCTGDWRTMPYVIGDRAASSFPHFVFESPRPPLDLPANMAQLEASYRAPVYWRNRSARGYLAARMEQFGRAFWIFLRPALLPPILVSVVGLWIARQWKLAIALAAALAALLIEVQVHPHYIAPFVPLYCLLLLLGFRTLRSWNPRGRPFGRAFSRSLVLVFGSAMLLAAGSLVSGTTLWANDAVFGCCGLSWPHPRDRIEQYLDGRASNSLVLVRYGPYSLIHYEYVYNSADPAQAKIVWARDLGREARRELYPAFPGREVWRLDIGTLPGGFTLTPCATGAALGLSEPCGP